jgi:hypothetical protein
VKGMKKMVTNNIFIKFKSGEIIAQAVEKLLSMKGKIPELTEILVKENLRETGFDIMIITNYKSLTDFEKYVVNPIHVDVGNFINENMEYQASFCYES